MLIMIIIIIIIIIIMNIIMMITIFIMGASPSAAAPSRAGSWCGAAAAPSWAHWSAGSWVALLTVPQKGYATRGSNRQITSRSRGCDRQTRSTERLGHIRLTGVERESLDGGRRLGNECTLGGRKKAGSSWSDGNGQGAAQGGPGQKMSQEGGASGRGARSEAPRRTANRKHVSCIGKTQRECKNTCVMQTIVNNNNVQRVVRCRCKLKVLANGLTWGGMA